MNSTRALARRFCGFQWDADEATREAINKRAARIVATGLAGKEQDPDDLCAWRVMAADVLLLNETLAPLEKRREEIEKEMKKLARSLPVWPWGKRCQRSWGTRSSAGSRTIRWQTRGTA
jgi:hypothetical protein